MNVIQDKNLKAPAPTEAAMQQLLASLAAFAGPNDPLTVSLSMENWPGRKATHLVYFAGLRTIVEMKERLDESKLGPLSWRFYVGGHKNASTAASCWATHERTGMPVKVMSTMRGPEAAEILRSTELLNDLPALSDHPGHEYQLRVLRIPGLYVEGFWLKSASAGRNDLIVPYGMAVDGQASIKLSGGASLTKNKAYAVGEFLSIVGQAAEYRLAAAAQAASVHPGRLNPDGKGTMLDTVPAKPKGVAAPTGHKPGAGSTKTPPPIGKPAPVLKTATPPSKTTIVEAEPNAGRLKPNSRRAKAGE